MSDLDTGHPTTTVLALEGKQSSGALVIDDFVEVTSQVPAGACVAAVWGEDGEAVGSLLTGFTPLSQTVPTVLLVAAEDASAVTRLGVGGQCSVALLSEDQDDLLPALRGTGAGLGHEVWRVTPHSLPVLDGVACWLECTVLQIHRSAGSVIVIADVLAVGLAENRRPLLGFQGGFGQFVPGQLSSYTAPVGGSARRVAELAREPIEVLARDLGVECSLVTIQEGDSVAVAVANHSASARRTRLGNRIPVVPPLGIHFVDAPDGGLTEEEWLGRLGSASPIELNLVKSQLARVRERGWSIMLSGPLSIPEIDALVGAYTEATDHQDDRASALVGAIRSMAASHEPEHIVPDDVYDVIAMSVPVRSPQGAVLAVVRLLALPPQVLGSEVLLWLSMLQDAARSVEGLLEPRPIGS